MDVRETDRCLDGEPAPPSPRLSAVPRQAEWADGKYPGRKTMEEVLDTLLLDTIPDVGDVVVDDHALVLAGVDELGSAFGSGPSRRLAEGFFKDDTGFDQCVVFVDLGEVEAAEERAMEGVPAVNLLLLGGRHDEAKNPEEGDKAEGDDGVKNDEDLPGDASDVEDGAAPAGKSRIHGGERGEDVGGVEKSYVVDEGHNDTGTEDGRCAVGRSVDVGEKSEENGSSDDEGGECHWIER